MDSRHCVGLFVLLSVSVLAGCGPTNPERVPVYGQVTVDGQAAEDGVVRFEPIGEERGMNRASAMVPIVNGKYQVETGGGLQQGRYRVRIRVERKTGKKTKRRTFSGDILEVDETVLVSSPRHAGKESPLEYTAQSASDRQFDIDVPAR